jgi:hypothetical protein
MEPIFVYLLMSLVISVIAIKEDRLNKKIAEGFNPNAIDRDKDGIVQEGTRFERKVKIKNGRIK